jgi:hypothetical protein
MSKLEFEKYNPDFGLAGANVDALEKGEKLYDPDDDKIKPHIPEQVLLKQMYGDP